MEIRAMISRTLERGKVDFTIWVEKDDTQTATPINGVILDNYYQQIKQISEERHIPLPADWFATLLRLPDVMTRTEVEELDEEEWTAVRTAIEGSHRQARGLPQTGRCRTAKEIHRENTKHRRFAEKHRAV